MIVVGGFNASIDKHALAEDVRIGAVTRLRDVTACPGGKGAHVALAIAALGEPVRLVGPVDAGSRAWFEEFFGAHGVTFEPVEIRALLRTCVAVTDAAGRTTELLEPGPALDAAERARLLDGLRAAAAEASCVVLSGSVPPDLPSSTYADLVTDLQTSARRVAIDASGELLARALARGPFLIKPNAEEGAEAAGAPITDVASAAAAASVLARPGPHMVAISLGAAGMVLRRGGRTWHASPPSVPGARYPVGSGDCLLGGLMVAVARGFTIEETCRLAVACGTANTLTPEPGLFRRGDVDALLPQVTVSEL